MTEYVYKIRSKDGTYSSGGSQPSFSKKGKVWSTKGALSNHFNVLDKIGKDRYLRLECEVITIEIVETQTLTESVVSFIAAAGLRTKMREAEAAKSRLEYLQKQELAQLKRLKEIYVGKDENF